MQDIFKMICSHRENGLHPLYILSITDDNRKRNIKFEKYLGSEKRQETYKLVRVYSGCIL